MWEYFAKVVKVYDGDTITVDVDLGFGVSFRKMTVRLYGINAPEVRGPERQKGLEARDWLRDRILGKEVRIRTVQDRKGKYGRYLAFVYTIEGGSSVDGTSLNDQLVRFGYAEKRDYG